jgi:hypothetical protein
MHPAGNYKNKGKQPKNREDNKKKPSFAKQRGLGR